MNELLIFDLDNTLLAGDSDRNWGIFLAEQKVVKSSYPVSYTHLTLPTTD